MNFDQLGQSWRDENEGASAEERLEQHVKTTRTIERFAGRIFRRDLIESAVCVYLIYTFGKMLFDKALIASTTLPSVFVFGVVVNVLGSVHVIYRLHRARTSTPAPSLDAPMREYVETEITRVEKQIALLKSIHLWYLGPFYVGVNAMFLSYDGPCLEFAIMLVVVTALYWFLYALNRLAATTSVAAIRDELVWARDQLDGKEGSPPEPRDPAADAKTGLRFGLRWFAILLGIGLGGAALGWWVELDIPKRSPFEAVRWREDKPEIQLDNEWLSLHAVNGVPVGEIIDFSQSAYGQRWRKPFEEDLVEVLTRMGRKPKDHMSLLVTPIGTILGIEQKTVPLTKAYREIMERAAAMRKEREQEPE